MPFSIQRALLALCLCCLSACSSTSCHQWEIQEILTKTSCFNAGRLILAPDSDCSFLEFEITRNRSGIRCYLNLLFLQASPFPDDPNRTRIEILFEDQEPRLVYPYLLNGGQRLLLPGDSADVLIQALLDDLPFTIKIGRANLQVVSTNFEAVYSRLLALDIEEDVPNEDLPAIQ